MEVYIKKGVTRVDPRRPETHPGYKDAVKYGRENLPHMRFENGAERRDYMKAVAANPNNVAGIPAFYPPLHMAPMAVPQMALVPEDLKARLAIWDSLNVDGELFCTTCDSLTAFAFTPNQTFCKKCGKQYTFRRRAFAS